MARTAPVTTGSTREMHVNDEMLRQPNDVQFDSDGARIAEEIITEADPALLMKDYADALSFMEEKVLIRIEPGREEFEAKARDYSVNGRTVWVPVGEPVWVRRKYVEVMARNAQTEVRTANQQDDATQSLIDLTKVTRRNRSLTSFSVLRDTDKGFAWLQKVRAETV